MTQRTRDTVSSNRCAVQRQDEARTKPPRLVDTGPSAALGTFAGRSTACARRPGRHLSVSPPGPTKSTPVRRAAARRLRNDAITSADLRSYDRPAGMSTPLSGSSGSPREPLGIGGSENEPGSAPLALPALPVPEPTARARCAEPRFSGPPTACRHRAPVAST